MGIPKDRSIRIGSCRFALRCLARTCLMGPPGGVGAPELYPMAEADAGVYFVTSSPQQRLGSSFSLLGTVYNYPKTRRFSLLL
ncbi:hypothetical protein VUR80DRAFT_1594 [Thermomyces stellatus]